MKIDELQQLRIGNWIFDHKGVPRQIAYITEETIGLRLNPDSTMKYQENPILSGEIAELKPIQINGSTFRLYTNLKQISKGKFELPGIGNAVSLLFDTTIFTDSIIVKAFFGKDESGFIWKQITNIQYLHELQNIVYSIYRYNINIEIPER